MIRTTQKSGKVQAAFALGEKRVVFNTCPSAEEENKRQITISYRVPLGAERRCALDTSFSTIHKSAAGLRCWLWPSFHETVLSTGRGRRFS